MPDKLSSLSTWPGSKDGRLSTSTREMRVDGEGSYRTRGDRCCTRHAGDASWRWSRSHKTRPQAHALRLTAAAMVGTTAGRPAATAYRSRSGYGAVTPRRARTAVTARWKP